MANYKAPGVYIEEVQSGARPIQAVGTSTAGFIGVAPGKNAPKQTAVRINNWQQFVKTFLDEPGKEEPTELTDLVRAVYGFYQNGGTTCYVVNIGKSAPLAGGATKKREGLQLFEEIDEIAIVAAPGYTSKVDCDALLTHCEKMKDRFAVLDAPKSVASIDAFLTEDTAKNIAPRMSKNGFGAVYYPWIKVADFTAQEMDLKTVPPSGFIAGIYARVDGTLGVHKAPANELIKGAQGLAYNMTQDEIGDLNDNCINCIKNFPGEGIKVWGARTRAGASSVWKYVNVRRLFNMIEESIVESTSWVVFEPNDFTLWNTIKRDVSAFLTMLWRQGALFGRTPEEAFFVKCDEETNPPEEIDAGRVIIEIGIAPVKPAEFVIFRIGQSQKGATRL